MKYIKSSLAVLTLIMTVALTTGCSNLADARAAKGTGVTRTYDATMDATWDEIPRVLEDVSLPLAGENRQKGYFLAQRGLTAFSYGENVVIYVEPVSDVATKVEVISKRASAANIFAPDWSNEILDKLAERLNKNQTRTRQ